ncbi:type VI secretion system protein TssA [Roseomonas xinghualingensis]|uniref:type VI secretion system protein TssA n=1 Tax=Roseomonas xinghualingensis TaxID=2986475 RepID=UPI0021F21468|nr:type VI secretion system protein TssA [Roseomonas sp. SXEYE001]MCV4209673.1 type VI secretion system protein TssA [Roseomonas sp. SXEYE001]
MALPIDAQDLEALLAPITEDAPAGADLREDYSPTSLYFQLRDARAEARDIERQSEAADADEAPPNQWRTVQSLAIRALTTGAKDLEVAAWLTEALVRTAGLQGLAMGATIIARLVNLYWDHLFPLPDEDGIETRVAPVAGLAGQGVDGTLMQPLRKTMLFSRPDGTPFGLWRYVATLELSGITDPDRRAARVEAGIVPFEEVEKEARIAGGAHWAALRAEVSAAMASWAEMSQALDEKAGADSPSTSRVRDVLQLLLETCSRFAPAVPSAEADSEALAAADDAMPVTTTSPGGMPANAMAAAIAGREQALRQLGEIAAWFRNTEPHSPISYTLDEAIRRGRMTWPDLIAEILPDQTTRDALITALGIRPRPPEE